MFSRRRVERLVCGRALTASARLPRCARRTMGQRSLSSRRSTPAQRIGNVVLIIIDPVSAYLGAGKVDGRSATDVRGVLTPMKDMAEELHVAVIGIAHFNKKDDIKSALVRALAAVGAFCIDKWKHRMAWYQNPSMCVNPRQRMAPWLRWRSRNA